MSAPTVYLDQDGNPWIFDPDRDMWITGDGMLDWDEMRGWHPEVVEQWAAQQLDAAGGVR